MFFLVVTDPESFQEVFWVVFKKQNNQINKAKQKKSKTKQNQAQNPTNCREKSVSEKLQIVQFNLCVNHISASLHIHNRQ